LNWLRNGKRIRPGNTARGFSVAWRAFLEGKELQLIRFDPSKPIDIPTVPLAEEVDRARSLPTAAATDEASEPRSDHARRERFAENTQSLPL
jgi:hypothetical protein